MTTAHTRSCNRTGNAEPGPTQTFFFEDVAIKIHRKNTFKIDNLFSKKTRRQYAIVPQADDIAFPICCYIFYRHWQ